VADDTQSTEVPDEAVKALVMRRVGDDFGGRYAGPEGLRRFEDERPADRVHYLSRARYDLEAGAPFLRKQGAEEERERLAIPEAKLLAALEAVRREVKGWADRAERDGNDREAETLDAAVEAFALDTPERILAAMARDRLLRASSKEVGGDDE
jgi:hypothetical protein